ncbi:MAG: zf-HC2 domain-containing protein [Gemmatimonadetes bacterium]|nr:zf-HC2 domain-containing protein [Gemmatimonadota bacterium]
MTDTRMTCDRAMAQLANWLDGQLDDATARAVEAHVQGCAACGAVLASLDVQDEEAASLPVLAPSRDLWPAIAGRIQPATVALAERRPSTVVPRRFGWVAQLAAASALVVVTAGVTWRAAVSVGARATDAGLSALGNVGRYEASPGAVGIRNTGGDRVPVEFTYDRELSGLRRVVGERRRDLDPATLAVLDRNLKLIDRAIAQSKAALESDPASTMLSEQLTVALDKKLQLLRTVALLPSRS